MALNVHKIPDAQEQQRLKDLAEQKAILRLTQYPEWDIFSTYLQNIRDVINRVDRMNPEETLDNIRGQISTLDFILSTPTIAEAVLTQAQEDNSYQDDDE